MSSKVNFLEIRLDANCLDRKILDGLKAQISDMMLLICEDEKPLGFYENKNKEGEDEDDKGKDKKKDKEKDKDKKKDKEKEKDKKKEKGKSVKKGKDKKKIKMDDSYYDNYFKKDFIKLAIGEKLRKGVDGAIESKKKINFEIFKDELEV